MVWAPLWVSLRCFVGRMTNINYAKKLKVGEQDDPKNSEDDKGRGRKPNKPP